MLIRTLASLLVMTVADPVQALNDPFAAHPSGSESALLGDLTLNWPGARERLTAAVNAAGAGEAFRKAGWTLLCADAYRQGRWREATQACERGGDASTLAIVRGLADLPPPAVEAVGATVVLDATGRTPVVIGEHTAAGVIDTGAELTVMMDSVARAGGVRFIGEAPRVETTTAPVSARFGVIPVMRIGGVRVTNVPVLVLPDAQLTFDEGRVRLEAIIGLHAFLPFGRVAWTDHGRTLRMGMASPRGDGEGAPLFWHEFGFGVAVEGAGGRMPAHWDTGANRTAFYPAGLALLTPEETAAQRSVQLRTGGVGGVRTEQGRRLPRASLRLAGAPLVLENIDVAARDENGDALRLGLDVVHRFDTVIVDFERMRMFIRP